MLVSVDVGDLNASTLKLLDLCDGFAFDMLWLDNAAQKGLDKVEEGRTEVFTVDSYKGRDGGRRRNGNAIGEDDVATYAECGMGVGDGDGVFECRASCHEGGGGECVGFVKFCDGAIDARGETEVVRINDEPGGHEVGGQLRDASHSN